MLKNIRVTPLAAESLGVRSMCAFVETRDIKVILDAAASLGPSRWGLPPHPREYKALAECRDRIAKATENRETVSVDIGLLHIPVRLAEFSSVLGAGFVAQSVGYPPVFVASGIFFVAFSVLSLYVLKRERN